MVIASSISWSSRAALIKASSMILSERHDSEQHGGVTSTVMVNRMVISNQHGHSQTARLSVRGASRGDR
jgi:hypothetical protein